MYPNIILLVTYPAFLDDFPILTRDSLVFPSDVQPVVQFYPYYIPIIFLLEQSHSSMICYYCPSQQYVRLYIIRLLFVELYFYVDISKSNIIMSYPHLPSCNLRCRKATICRSLNRKQHFSRSILV